MKILLIDDEKAWLRSLKLILVQSGTASGENIMTAENYTDGEKLLKEYGAGLVLLDLMLKDETGEEVLKKIKKSFPETTVVIMTGVGSIQKAVNCIELGAADYLVKTMPSSELTESVARIIKKAEEDGGDNAKRYPGFEKFITRDPAALDIFSYLTSVASSSEPVLITGESGTGKGVLAECFAAVSRPGAPFVSINVSGLDDQMFSDALFGHEKGAFTGAETKRNGIISQAGNGTLFLDEIGDIKPESQAKLLYFTQTGEYRRLGSDRLFKSEARLIFATNRNLDEKINSSGFRRDLYYRLSTHSVRLPALRERRDDVPILIKHFIKEAAQKLGKPEPKVHDNIMLLMRSYEFPGNVRELRSMVYDMTARCQSDTVTVKDIAGHFRFPDRKESEREPIPTIDDMIDGLIEKAMKQTGGNQTKAAAIIGVSQSFISRRLKKQ